MSMNLKKKKKRENLREQVSHFDSTLRGYLYVRAIVVPSVYTYVSV